jgi:hypothetical protein
MNNTTSQQGKTKEKARTAHFRDDPTEDGKTAYARLTASNQKPNNTTKNTNNQKPKNKKQKTSTRKSYKEASLSRGGNTNLFATAPATNNARIKNSRKATLARHQGQGHRKGSAQEVKFAHKTRFDVNFTLTAATIDGRINELQIGIDEILRTIVNIDNQAKLLPWKSANQAFHPAIESTNDTTASFIDIYLSRTWLGNIEKNHRAYFQIHVGHDEEYDNILPAFDDFNSHSDRNFQHSMLQAEDTSFIGWFLYSTINIDVGGLSDAIFECLGFEVGLRWMDIRMSNKGGKGKAKPVRAIHVEVEKTQSRRVTESLMKFYGRKFEESNDFPLGIRLRFCKNIDSASYLKERTKLIRLRARQAQIIDETQKYTSVGILDLDVLLDLKEGKSDNENTNTQITLRQAIMAIKSKETKNTPLFSSVDISYNSEDFVFAYHQSLAGEARAMVDYLFPYLEYYYTSQSLKRAFDKAHIKEMSSFKYNVTKDRVEDTIAEEAYANIEEDNISGAIKFAAFDLSAMSLEDDNGERPAASILGKMYGDSDSISTQQHGRGRKNSNDYISKEVLEVTEEELMELQRRTLMHTQTKNKTSARKDTMHIHNLDTKTMLDQIRKEKEGKKKEHNTINLTNTDTSLSDGEKTNDSEGTDDSDSEINHDHNNESSTDDSDMEENSTTEEYDNMHVQDKDESSDDNSMEEEEEFKDAEQMDETHSAKEQYILDGEAPSATHERSSQSNHDSNVDPPPTGGGGEGY